MDFNRSHGINFWISFYFFQKFDLSVFVNFEKFYPRYGVTFGVNFEILNLHLCMDYCEFALVDEAKGFSWLTGEKILNFILFFQKLDLSVFVDSEKFQPW